MPPNEIPVVMQEEVKEEESSDDDDDSLNCVDEEIKDDLDTAITAIFEEHDERKISFHPSKALDRSWIFNLVITLFLKSDPDSKNKHLIIHFFFWN